jgi:uncharacterized protein (TIGR03067 family)
MSAAQVREADWRLADAQSAIARKSGFESWPRLARHVEQLRSLEGTWSFVRLEIDGGTIPPVGLGASRLLIDGDRFRMESPEATYEGVFNIDVESDPQRIDIEFVEGPEAGNWNYGIFRITDDLLEICLDVNAKPAPAQFRTSPGSGHAYEILKRTSGARPRSVNGGTPGAALSGAGVCAPIPSPGGAEAGSPLGEADFKYVASPTLTRLQGEWSSEKLVRDGQELPEMIRKTGRRVAKENEITISFGGQVMVHVLVRIDERQNPVHVDYFNLAGSAKGAIQHGIMEWRESDACFCMASPGKPRPTDFECPAGSGRTLSRWRPNG